MFILALIFFFTVFLSAAPCDEPAQGKILADKVVSLEKYDVEYVLPTKEGQDVVLLLNYKSDDPKELPDGALFYFPNQARPFTGEKLFHIASEEGEDIGLRFIYRDDASYDTISLEPPLTQEPSQKNLTVKSKGGYIVQFVIVSNEGLLRSLFIEPAPHPFVNVYQPPEHLQQSVQ